MNFIELGHYYGYPDCCIEEFITYVFLYTQGKAPKREKRKFDGTGYVPCKICNTLPTKQLLETIAKNRKHDKPFPNQD